VTILRSITSQNPYKLFDELPEDENVFDTLQLFDYLGLQSFPLPLLRTIYLVRSKSINNEVKNQQVQYHQANVSEVRRTAAEFIIALAKNEYKLRDSNTIYTIFNLINSILFNAGIFNLRFRDHTLEIVKKRCYSLFSKIQRCQLESSHRLPQYEKINSKKFQSLFSWRGVYVQIQDNHTKSSVTKLNDTKSSVTRLNDTTRLRNTSSMRDTTWLRDIITQYDRLNQIISDALTLFRENIRHHEIIQLNERIVDTESTVISNLYSPYQPLNVSGADDLDEELYIPELYEKAEETESARSRRFNTVYIHTRPKVDKFKHRCGPKAQKYR
jgi:hypothetical protein